LVCFSSCVSQQSGDKAGVGGWAGLVGWTRVLHPAHPTERQSKIGPAPQDVNEPGRALPAKIRHAVSEEQVSLLKLPQDTTTRLTVRDVRITGNALISTEALLGELPLVYNASGVPLAEAEGGDLYDLRSVRAVIAGPGRPVEISLRSIQGLTQYILSVYHDSDYSGIYVFVPKGAIRDGVSLVDEVLAVNVIEAVVGEVGTKFYDAERNEVEEGILRRSALESWMPVKEGEVANQRALDNTLNLLNLDPDRYIAARVSPGSEPNTLAVRYDVYETSPWHYFIQVDSSGTDDRQWSPRVGVINTNLLGFDDRFTAIYQATPDSHFEENYSAYGSYDFPIMGPRLRLNLFGGYSEFDINPESGPIDFIGSGSFYGAVLRYNVFQRRGWFFDVTGSLSHEESDVTPSMFPQFLASDIAMDLWAVGVNVHRRNDTSSTSVVVNRVESMGGSGQRSFWDTVTGTGARMNADRDFAIYTASANHSQYLDQNKVQQVRGILRWIEPTDRLVPAKMTSFGGMYSVRGYDEYEVVADGGILASVQYEFDLVRHGRAVEPESVRNKDLRKLAPLAFIDFGRSSVEDAVPGERSNQTLASVGSGMIIEIGNNVSGALYYGYPLKATATTRRGKGRLSASLMVRW
jgi:hemolysin activation/secretion protein